MHGVPNTARLWRPFLERTGGLAPDLPGFGQSAKPAAFDYSIAGLSGWLKSFLAERGVERYSLVAHDWGAAALALAQAEPQRLERLVLMDAVPLLPGYEWHTLARQWRRPLVGEMAMGFTFKFVARRLLRLPDGSDFPAAELDDIWDHFDHGTQRAILRLYRSAPPARWPPRAPIWPSCAARRWWSGATGPVPARALRPRVRRRAGRPRASRGRGRGRPLAVDRAARSGRPRGLVPGLTGARRTTLTAA